MRTTIVIDDNLLEELILTSDSKSRSAAISEAASDYVSRKKRGGTLELKGKIRFEEAHLERLKEAEEKERENQCRLLTSDRHFEALPSFEG